MYQLEYCTLPWVQSKLSYCYYWELQLLCVCVCPKAFYNALSASTIQLTLDTLNLLTALHLKSENHSCQQIQNLSISHHMTTLSTLSSTPGARQWNTLSQCEQLLTITNKHTERNKKSRVCCYLLRLERALTCLLTWSTAAERHVLSTMKY